VEPSLPSNEYEGKTHSVALISPITDNDARAFDSVTMVGGPGAAELQAPSSHGGYVTHDGASAASGNVLRAARTPIRGEVVPGTGDARYPNAISTLPASAKVTPYARSLGTPSSRR